MSRWDQPPALRGTAGVGRTRFNLQRLGIVMESEAGNPFEVEGVLNPAAARGPDGELYLFPRLVSRGNYSRIGVARVRFSDDGDPVAVERLGIALEPTAEYELRADGGGCEDPRITFIEPLQRYVMTYTAFSSEGPRIALAISDDLFHWERLGLATFERHHGLDFNGVNNKDALVVPRRGARSERTTRDGDDPPSAVSGDRRRGDRRRADGEGDRPGSRKHLDRVLPARSGRDGAPPSVPLPLTPSPGVAGRTVGAPEDRRGAPPILTPDGWLVIYHGVGESHLEGGEVRNLRYSAGALVLDERDPRLIRYRSPTPILVPELREEREGSVAEVVFPTGVDRRSDLGYPSRIDVYYGMADSRIGAARLDVPVPPPPSAG